MHGSRWISSVRAVPELIEQLALGAVSTGRRHHSRAGSLRSSAGWRPRRSLTSHGDTPSDCQIARRVLSILAASRQLFSVRGFRHVHDRPRAAGAVAGLGVRRRRNGPGPYPRVGASRGHRGPARSPTRWSLRPSRRYLAQVWGRSVSPAHGSREGECLSAVVEVLSLWCPGRCRRRWRLVCSRVRWCARRCQTVRWSAGWSWRRGRQHWGGSRQPSGEPAVLLDSATLERPARVAFGQIGWWAGLQHPRAGDRACRVRLGGDSGAVRAFGHRRRADRCARPGRRGA